MTRWHDKDSIDRLLHQWFGGVSRAFWIGGPESRPTGSTATALDFLTVTQLLETPPVGGAIEDANSTFSGDRISQQSKPCVGGAIWSVAGEDIKGRSAFEIACRLREILPGDGVLLVLWPSEESLVGPSPSELSLLLERLGFERSAGQAGNAAQVFRRNAGAGSRAVDRIESILGKDRKVATYKLALVRALAEIAQSAYHGVRWHGDKVLVPLDAISERWLFYYWPIFAENGFIPQIQKEGQAGARPVRFRSALTAVIDQYRHQGGLSAFHATYFGSEAFRARGEVKKAIREISATIITGPVAHAGGRDNPVFAMESFGGRKYVCVPYDIWRELTLLSTWISDAVVVRWIDKTVELSGGVGYDRIVKALLERPNPERTTDMARQCYLERDHLSCVWTGRAITAESMQVDHVIPYSLWRNNDLWNLVPASSGANSSKSDMLPSHEKLQECKRRIVESWSWLRDHHESRFDAELERAVGQRLTSDWRKVAFDYVREAVEVTAVQRVVDRWPRT